jgi:hypothetical protein
MLEMQDLSRYAIGSYNSEGTLKGNFEENPAGCTYDGSVR